MRLAGICEESLFNTQGVNTVIFTQGCPHKCPGCQNPSTWELNGGYSVPAGVLIQHIQSNAKMSSGIVFSGGEPIMQIDEVITIARRARELGKSVTMYTGYTLSFDQEDEVVCSCKYCATTFPKEYLKWIDTIIDGPFEQTMRDYSEEPKVVQINEF